MAKKTADDLTPKAAETVVATPSERTVARRNVAQKLEELGIDPGNTRPPTVSEIDWSPKRAYEFVGTDYDPENYQYLRADFDDGGKQVRLLCEEGWQPNVDIDVRMRGVHRPDEVILVRDRKVADEFERRNAELVRNRRRVRSEDHEVSVGGKTMTARYDERPATVRGTHGNGETGSPPTRR